MRYLAPVIFIALFAAGIHFVNKSTPLTSNPTGLDALDEKAKKLQEKLDGKFSDEQIIEVIENAPDEVLERNGLMDEPQDDRHDNSHFRDEREVIGDQREFSEDTLEEEQDMDSSEIEEYSEEVSDEDFNEFLGAALEEISEDPEMARAIIVEMAKIYKVQPDHQQKIIQFYEDCASNSKIPNEIKNICDRERYNLK